MSSNSTGIPLYRFAVKCFLPTMFPLSRSCHLTARLDFIFSDHSVVASTTHSVIFTASRQTLFPQERKTFFILNVKLPMSITGISMLFSSLLVFCLISLL